ncbi:MAG: hypothetical protein JKY86_01315 [Gammaproteobacteria bacterium]|nr:hypothetical protein [Gammaproteobacteria bacterium]
MYTWKFILTPFLIRDRIPLYCLKARRCLDDILIEIFNNIPTFGVLACHFQNLNAGKHRVVNI